MTYLQFSRLIVAGLLIAAAAAMPARAQQAKNDPGGPLMAVINLEEISRKALLFNSIRDQLEKYNADFNAVVQAEEDELRKADHELARQRAILAPDAYAQQRREFEKRVVEFQRQGQRRKQNLDAVRARAQIEANKALKQAIDEFAAENRITLILRSDLIAFFNPAMDVTPRVLERLDKKVPSIKVPQPEK